MRWTKHVSYKHIHDKNIETVYIISMVVVLKLNDDAVRSETDQ